MKISIKIIYLNHKSVTFGNFMIMDINNRGVESCSIRYPCITQWSSGIPDVI